MVNREWMDSSNRRCQAVRADGAVAREDLAAAVASVAADLVEAAAEVDLAAADLADGADPAARNVREMGSVETEPILETARIEGGRVSTARLHSA